MLGEGVKVPLLQVTRSSWAALAVDSEFDAGFPAYMRNGLSFIVDFIDKPS